MKTTKVSTIKIGGIEFAIPPGMTDKEVAAFCGIALQFRKLDYFHANDYRKPFTYFDGYVEVSRGTRDTFETEEEARAARDARNAELEAADARSRADDLALGS
jgi:hypothetical protein